MKRWVPLLLVFGFLLVTGCGTPSHYVKILPATGRTFPPISPSLVRLPVVVVIPTGSNVVEHFSSFLKGGFKRVIPNSFQLPGLNLKPRVFDLWSKMQEPIFLEKDIWLMIWPETLSIGVVKGDLKNILSAHTVLEMTAHPELVFGPKPEVTKRLLPPMGKFKSGPPGFHAMGDTLITYREANQFLRDPKAGLIGRVLPNTGDRKLIIKGIRLYGSGGKVIAEVKLQFKPADVNFKGKPGRLTVYLRGTPRYLPKERAFDMPDLDLDIKSNDLLVQVALLFAQPAIRDDLRKHTKVPIGPKLDKLKERMMVVLNKPLGLFARINTQVDSFKLLDAFADNEGIEVRLSLRGVASLNVIWN